MRYNIKVKKSAQKSLTHISHQDQKRIIKAIKNLESDPRPYGSKKLAGRDV